MRKGLIRWRLRRLRPAIKRATFKKVYVLFNLLYNINSAIKKARFLISIQGGVV